VFRAGHLAGRVGLRLDLVRRRRLRRQYYVAVGAHRGAMCLAASVRYPLLLLYHEHKDEKPGGQRKSFPPPRPSFRPARSKHRCLVLRPCSSSSLSSCPLQSHESSRPDRPLKNWPRSSRSSPRASTGRSDSPPREACRPVSRARGALPGLARLSGIPPVVVVRLPRNTPPSRRPPPSVAPNHGSAHYVPRPSPAGVTARTP